ncbi:MAG: hypothetical protein NZ908_02370, partial [Candidatus Micrarchaeota archaeon]|nr:hypothetical protein [Candidatus Micrarchaeota archaeon]
SKDTPDTYRHKDSQRKIERTKISRIVRDAKDIIQQYMRNRGLDMKSLSSVSGVSERDIRSIMERKLIDLNTIRKLERVIGKNLVEEEIITELVSTDDRRSDSRATLGDFVESDGK